MTNFATIINGIFSATDKNDYVNAICGYDLLIIDDLGVESHSEYRMEGLFNVIDRRACSGKPMIITTNLTMKEMDETQDLNEAIAKMNEIAKSGSTVLFENDLPDLYNEKLI